MLVQPSQLSKAARAPARVGCQEASVIVTRVRAPSSIGSNSNVVRVVPSVLVVASPARFDPDSDDDRVFKALASPVRRRMLDALRERSRTTGSLCASLPDLDRTTVLQHLRVLEGAGLVTGRKVG